METEKETQKEKKGPRAETEKEAKEDTEHFTVNKKTVEKLAETQTSIRLASHLQQLNQFCH